MTSKTFENSRSSASNFKSFSRSLEHFFLTVGQNNFGNKIPFFLKTFLLLLQNSNAEDEYHDEFILKLRVLCNSEIEMNTKRREVS